MQFTAIPSAASQTWTYQQHCLLWWLWTRFLKVQKEGSLAINDTYKYLYKYLYKCDPGDGNCWTLLSAPCAARIARNPRRSPHCATLWDAGEWAGSHSCHTACDALQEPPSLLILAAQAWLSKETERQPDLKRKATRGPACGSKLRDCLRKWNNPRCWWWNVLLSTFKSHPLC